MALYVHACNIGVILLRICSRAGNVVLLFLLLSISAHSILFYLIYIALSQCSFLDIHDSTTFTQVDSLAIKPYARPWNTYISDYGNTCYLN